MKSNLCLALGLIMFLSGCSTLRVAPPVPKEADIAVTETPPAKDVRQIILQALPVDLLLPTDKLNYPKIADAYDQSIVIQAGELNACMLELAGYQAPPKN